MSAILPGIAAERTHWYTAQGVPCHQIQQKTDPTKFRAVNLADARKQTLFPSVTNVLSVLAKPGLEAWKQEQMVLSALTLPRKPGETDDLFAKRVVEDARTQAEQAAEFGTLVHTFIAEWHAKRNPAVPVKAEASIMAYIKLASKRLNHTASEFPFACQRHGYGGTVDFIGRMDGDEAVIDFKTRTTTPGQPVPAYETDGLQLVAYANGTGHHSARLVNIVLSSTEPGRVEIVEWTDQRDDLWNAFLHCLALWQWTKKYNPKEGM